MARGRKGSSREGGSRKGGKESAEIGRRAREILGLSLVGGGVFLALSGMSYGFGTYDDPLEPAVRENWGGFVGHLLGGFLMQAFGLASFLLAAFLVYWGILHLRHRGIERPWTRLAGVLGLVLVLAIFLAGSGPEPRGISLRTPYGLGGWIGLVLGPRLHASFGPLGAWLLLAMTGSIAFFLATDWALSQVVRDLGGGLLSSSTESGEEGVPGRKVLKRTFAGTARFARFLAHGLHRPAPAGAGGGAELELEEEDEDSAAPRRRRVSRRRREAAQPVGGRMLEEGDLAPRDPPGSEKEEPSRVSGESGKGGVAETGDETSGRSSRRTRRRRRIEEDPAPPAPEKTAPKETAVPIRISVNRSGAAPGRKQRRRRGPWPFPPFELLEPAEVSDPGVTDSGLQSLARAIEKRLESLRVEARVVAISAGPAVTVFELELGEGQRIGILRNFAPDLAAALKAMSVRVVAPIPGKHTVGVEVPNRIRTMVRLRELLELRDLSRMPETVPLFLGRDVSGEPIIEDLARMPHLLIAGATGSGKSVCINSILLSILMTRSPDQVRLILIDPKMVELQNFKKIPHLLCPVVTNMKRASAVLNWAVETMEQRYALLSSAGVRNLASYNALGEEKLKRRLGPAFDPERTPVHLPSIVLIIDEFADLMAVSASDVELSIQRLAQKSRAVGLHVILATQRPSRDVITGLIKANLPTRIAFKVSSRVDSRVVLDTNGADQLLGNGDLLYIPPGTHQLVRAQGTFISDDEIHGVVSFLEQEAGEQEFEETLVQNPTGSGRRPEERDSLYLEAVRTVLEEQRGSATLLQRKLSVGYTRASRLIELMAEDGIVGEFQGSKSREVLMSLEEWEASLGAEEEPRGLAGGGGLPAGEAVPDPAGEATPDPAREDEEPEEEPEEEREEENGGSWEEGPEEEWKTSFDEDEAEEEDVEDEGEDEESYEDFDDEDDAEDDDFEDEDYEEEEDAPDEDEDGVESPDDEGLEGEADEEDGEDGEEEEERS